MGAVFFVGALIVALILLGLFAVGLGLLIVGIVGTVQKKKPRNAWKKAPAACLASGTVCLLLSIVMTASFAVSFVIPLCELIFRSDTVINGLLTAADAGDRDAFEKMFAPKIRKRGDFQAAVDAFFESYPNGLSHYDRKHGHDNKQNPDGCERCRTCYTCFLDGEWYYIELHYCFDDTDTGEFPEEEGVTFFCIENIEANALDRDYGKDEFIACEIVDESEVNARLIANRGYVFTPTPDRSITVKEMKAYLAQYDNVKDLFAQIGKPNVSKKNGSSAYDYFYELVPENGEPRYMYLYAEEYVPARSKGKIYRHWICTELTPYYLKLKN